MQQQTTFQSYSKYRKPFLTVHYPFLTSSQINSKLRQEWTSLKSPQLKKTKLKSKATESQSHSKSPSSRCSTLQHQASFSSSADVELEKSFLDSDSTPLYRDDAFFSDDDYYDNDDDIESPYQRTKSRIDQLNSSAFSNNSRNQHTRQHFLNLPNKSHLQSKCELASDSRKSTYDKFIKSRPQSKAETETTHVSGAEYHFSDEDEDDYDFISRNNFTANIKNYSGSVFKLKYPVPDIEFDGNTIDSEVTPSILKKSRALSLNKINGDTPKSKVRFSHLTPSSGVTHQYFKDHNYNNSKISNSSLQPNINELSETQKDPFGFENDEEAYPIRAPRKRVETENRFAPCAKDFDFVDDDIYDPFTFCSYTAFKEESDLNASNIENQTNKKMPMPTLVKSKSTSFLQNTISACSKIIKRNGKSPQGKMCYSRRKSASVLDNNAEPSDFHISNASKSKSDHHSQTKSRQLGSARMTTPPASKNKFVNDVYSSLYMDEEPPDMPFSKMTPSKHTKRPSLKETSSKKLTPSSIARQLRSMSKQLSATKILSSKESVETTLKSKQSPKSKKGRIFSKSKSDSNIKSLSAYDAVTEGSLVSQSRPTALGKHSKRVSFSPTTRQLRSSSRELATLPVFKHCNALESLNMLPASSRKKVSFSTGLSQSQSEDDSSFSSKGLDTKSRSYGYQETKLAQRKYDKNENLSSVELRQMELKNPKSASVDRVADSNTTRLLQSVSRQLSSNEVMNKTNSSWHNVRNAPKDLLPVSVIGMDSFCSDDLDNRSIYSDDENGALIVRHDEHHLETTGDNDDNNNFNGGPDDDYILHDNNDKFCGQNTSYDMPHSSFQGRSKGLIMDQYLERDIQTMSYRDDRILNEGQNHNHYTDKSVLNKNKIKGEENQLNTSNQTKLPIPTPRKSKRNLGKPTTERHSYSETFKNNILDSETSRIKTHNSERAAREMQESWNDDKAEIDQYLCNNQWNESEDQKNDAQNFKTSRIQYCERKKEGNKLQMQQERCTLGDRLHSNKNAERFGQEIIISDGKFERSRNEDAGSLRSTSKKTRNRSESLYFRDSGNNDYSTNSHYESGSGDVTNDVSEYQGDGNTNRWMSCDENHDKNQDEDDGDDDNAFFTSDKMMSHTDLRRGLRKIHTLRSIRSEILPAASNSMDAAVDSCSDSDLNADSCDDEYNIDDSRSNRHYMNNDQRATSQQTRMMTTSTRNGFTLTDMFDDLPDNRPHADTLALARRMFQSSNVETCSNFGSLFDEDDIFV